MVACVGFNQSYATETPANPSALIAVRFVITNFLLTFMRGFPVYMLHRRNTIVRIFQEKLMRRFLLLFLPVCLKFFSCHESIGKIRRICRLERVKGIEHSFLSLAYPPLLDRKRGDEALTLR